MVFTPITGTVSDVLYGFESSFRSGGTPDKRLGLNLRVDRFSVNRAYNRVYTLGSRRFVGDVPMRWSASFGMSAIMSSKDVFGFALVGGETGYSFDESVIPSAVVAVYMGGNVVTLKGFVARTISMNIRATDFVTVSVDGLAAEVSTGSGSATFSPPTTAYTYAGASITFGGGGITHGSNIMITSMTMRIEQNPNFVYALGDDKAALVYPRQFVVTGSINGYITDLSVLEALMSDANIASISVTLNGVNVETGGSAGSITINLTDIAKIENVSYSVAPAEAVTVSFDYAAKTIAVS